MMNSILNSSTSYNDFLVATSYKRMRLKTSASVYGSLVLWCVSNTVLALASLVVGYIVYSTTQLVATIET